MKRTLSLKRESLTSLTTEEMAAFRGAGGGDTGPQPTPPIYAPLTLAYKECLATSRDSLVVCSDGCGMTYGASCRC